MQKFTEKEKVEFATVKSSVLVEVEEKYSKRKSELQTIISKQNYTQKDFLPHNKQSHNKIQKDEAAGEAKDANVKLREEKKTAKKVLKKLEDVIAKETRTLLKERFKYLIFMYEAEHVGITATGEDDYNELYPNNNMPKDIEKTCLELHQEYCKNPEVFKLKGVD